VAKQSLEEQERIIQRAWDEAFHAAATDTAVAEPSGGYIVETFADHVIASVAHEYFDIPYKKKGGKITFAPRDEWQKVKEQKEWVPAKNALKAISRTDDELRVANYIVLFGGRDLEGFKMGATTPSRVNPDGSAGEYFAPETDLESAYTKTGRLLVDWEHGFDTASDAPTEDDPFGYVDWPTAKADTRGVWVERALFRHNEYMKWMEQLIDAGIVGTSSEAATGIERADDGKITKWPLKRDTLTITPTEWRNKGENVVAALKALGFQIEPEPEATPEAVQTAVVAGKARLFQLETSIYQLKE